MIVAGLPAKDEGLADLRAGGLKAIRGQLALQEGVVEADVHQKVRQAPTRLNERHRVVLPPQGFIRA
jgi:hypothetical protein